MGAKLTGQNSTRQMPPPTERKSTSFKFAARIAIKREKDASAALASLQSSEADPAAAVMIKQPRNVP
jgi:hypothetical protein